LKVSDYAGANGVDFSETPTGVIGIDYNASSVGIDFGTGANVKKIVLVPNNSNHRVVKKSMLDIYASVDNSIYSVIPRTDWDFMKDANGVITVTLKDAVLARYLKIHLKLDDWDEDGNPVDCKSFLNVSVKSSPPCQTGGDDFFQTLQLSGKVFDQGKICSKAFRSAKSIFGIFSKRNLRYSNGFRPFSFAVSTTL